MAKKKRGSDGLSTLLREKAAVVISDEGRDGALDMAEILAWRSWFNDHQRTLRSSGGRPTNPKWHMKRQIPFAEDVWVQLEQRAIVCSSSGTKIGPGQLAAFLLEEAVSSPLGEVHAVAHDASPGVGIEEPTNDPRFDDWHQRGVFAGCVTS